jgi:NAD(P)-dependent dehydrogenase (short-subunit alcohol dehydrogenase family)
MSHRLDGTAALVVGASRGIGEHVAERFADEGADVAVAARTESDLAAVADRIDGLAVPCDLAEEASVEAAVERTVEAFGRLDVVCNSAGVIARGPIHETPAAEMHRVIDVNLVGPMYLAKAAIPELIDTGGTLLNVSSEAGERGIEDLPAYCASKGGLNTLTRQLAIEYSDENVTVNAIAPGTTKTSMNEDVRETDPTWLEERRAAIPLGRIGDPEDVAGLAAYLASEEADYVTGEIVHIDGGTTVT